MSAVAAELKSLLLHAPRLTLAVAESLTAGHVQARVASVPGASEFFLGGMTAYSLDEKVRHLGVGRAAAKKVNSVSAEVAEEMARGVCALFKSDVGVATTGYAEASLAEGVTQPFAWWAVAMRGRAARKPVSARFPTGDTSGKYAMRHGRVECPGASRLAAQNIVADAVLAELVGFLRALRGEKVDG